MIGKFFGLLDEQATTDETIHASNTGGEIVLFWGDRMAAHDLSRAAITPHERHRADHGTV